MSMFETKRIKNKSKMTSNCSLSNITHSVDLSSSRKREDNMKYFKVKLNAQQIIVKDNSSSMFKSKTHLNKNYITKSDKNSFVMIMFAEDFNDCLAKARQLYKDASSIEVQEIKRATTSINLINNNKKVA